MSDSGSDAVGVPLLESPSTSGSPEPQSGKKRKHDSDSKPESKRAAKRKRTKKPKDIADDALDIEAGLNNAIAHMDSQLLADHVAQRTKRFQSDLSLMELEELQLPSSAIVDTTEYQDPRNLENLPTFLEKYAGKEMSKKKKNRLHDAPQAKGTPHTLIVAGAGLRAADITRAVRGFQTKEAKIAKLFAKHIKLNDAIQDAKKSRMNIGVGTPQRIMELLDDGKIQHTSCEPLLAANDMLQELSLQLGWKDL